MTALVFSPPSPGWWRFARGGAPVVRRPRHRRPAGRPDRPPLDHRRHRLLRCPVRHPALRRGVGTGRSRPRCC
jgi:hypothetical protein